jgi:hypothetical protein
MPKAWQVLNLTPAEHLGRQDTPETHLRDYTANSGISLRIGIASGS